MAEKDPKFTLPETSPLPEGLPNASQTIRALVVPAVQARSKTGDVLSSSQKSPGVPSGLPSAAETLRAPYVPLVPTYEDLVEEGILPGQTLKAAIRNIFPPDVDSGLYIPPLSSNPSVSEPTESSSPVTPVANSASQRLRSYPSAPVVPINAASTRPALIPPDKVVSFVDSRETDSVAPLNDSPLPPPPDFNSLRSADATPSSLNDEDEVEIDMPEAPVEDPYKVLNNMEVVVYEEVDDEALADTQAAPEEDEALADTQPVDLRASQAVVGAPISQEDLQAYADQQPPAAAQSGLLRRAFKWMGFGGGTREVPNS